MFNKLISLLKDPSFVMMLSIGIVVIIALPMLVSWVVVSFMMYCIGWGITYAVTLLAAVCFVGWVLYNHRKMIIKAWEDMNDV